MVTVTIRVTVIVTVTIAQTNQTAISKRVKNYSQHACPSRLHAHTLKVLNNLKPITLYGTLRKIQWRLSIVGLQGHEACVAKHAQVLDNLKAPPKGGVSQAGPAILQVYKESDVLDTYCAYENKSKMHTDTNMYIYFYFHMGKTRVCAIL